MEAFIVRPFGEKNGINFDDVEEKLILPALKKAGIEGHTTGVVLEAGNIRQDMFQLLLTSDLVIADISIHNANVFYELGVRHALRAGKTMLIRCSKDQVPFDLKTDRYLAYDENDLASKVDLLYDSLKQTLNSDRVDSPVFLMLPNLKPQNPEHFLAIPRDFAEEVNLAKAISNQGKLALLASEAQFFPWELAALRTIGESPYKSKFYENAKEIWERVRKRKPADIEANEYLATIYQRLCEQEIKRKPSIAMQFLAKSEQAINCLFEQFNTLDRDKRAEAYSLRARNEKAKWVGKWIDANPDEMRKEAIKSDFLLEAYKNYTFGFYEDLNHFYSGINALGLLRVIIDLATAESLVWESKFANSRMAIAALEEYREEFHKLAIVVGKAVESEKRVLEASNSKKPWVDMTLADIALLTSDRPDRVAMLYHGAVQASTGLNLEAPLRQLRMYAKIGILTDNVTAALKEFGHVPIKEEGNEKIILFTGHMIDRKDRAEPRFPEEREAEVRKRLKDSVAGILKSASSVDNFVGIAGGACGGDLLFQEICKELGIKTKMYLALPPEKYVVESVQFAGSSWVDRFYAVYEDKDTEVGILAETKEMPKWLQGQKGYSFWERNNMWLLHTALSYGGRNVTLLALWDGKGEDGPGGTKHMIEEVKKRGAKSMIVGL